MRLTSGTNAGAESGVDAEGRSAVPLAAFVAIDDEVCEGGEGELLPLEVEEGEESGTRVATAV